MPRLEIALLGPPRIELDGKPIETDRRKAIALLAYLAATGGAHTRDQLAALLWPDYEHTSAFAYLRRTLWELNKLLGSEWVEANRETVSLNQGSGYWLDTNSFQKPLAEPTSDVPALEEAIALYRGDFLSGFFVQDTAPFEDWQLQQAEYFRHEYGGGLEKLIGHYEQAGMYEKALPHARRWLSLDLLNEAAHRSIMRLHAALGNRSAAVHQYEACVEVLKKELNVHPQPETTALYERIVRGELQSTPAEHRAGLPAGHSPATHLPLLPTPFMGRRPEVEQIKSLMMIPDHRLVTLIGPGGIGKTRLSIQSASELANQFPDGAWFVPLAPLQSAEALIPGIAKALDFSFYQEEERPRQQLIDYLREKHLLLILDNFEQLVNGGAELVADILARTEDLKLLVTSRERLNLQGEQLYRVAGMRTPEVTDTANWTDPEEQARPFSALQLFVERARRVRPDFRLTRDNLAIVTEICKRVDGMPLGIELAAAWMEVLTPEEVAAEIHRSLDFLETDLQDISDRQRSMRAVFESSWKLLDDGEKKSFQRLTVFRGSFSREAAQHVSEASLRMLLGLANKSWLQQVEEGRFQLHDVLRQYGYERLRSSAEEWQAANDRHAAYFLDSVQELEQDLRGEKQIEAANTLNKEFGNNIQAAWDWLVERGRFGDLVDRMLPGIFHFGVIRSQGVGLAAMTKRARKAMPEPQSREDLLRRSILETVETFFEVHWFLMEDQPRERLTRLWATVEDTGMADEMGYWFLVLMLAYKWGVDVGKDFGDFQKFLRNPRIKNDPWVFGSALTVAYACAGGEATQSERYLTDALEVFRRIGVAHEQARTLQSLGYVARIKNSYDEAVQFKEAALELFEKAGDQFGAGWIWFDLADINLRRGHFDQAFHAYQEQRRIYEKLGNRRLVGTSLSWESMAASRYDTLEHALETRKRSVEIAQQEKNVNDYAWTIWEMGEVFRLMEDFEQAQMWYQKALPSFEKLQDFNGIGYYYRGLGDIALGLRQWEKAHQHFTKAVDAITQEHRSESTWSLAYIQAGLGRSLVGLGRFSEAGEVLRDSTRTAQRRNDWDLVLLALLGISELDSATGKFEQAVETAALIVNQPLSWNETKRQARAVLETAWGNLPEEVAHAAQARGKAVTLDNAVSSALEKS